MGSCWVGCDVWLVPLGLELEARSILTTRTFSSGFIPQTISDCPGIALLENSASMSKGIPSNIYFVMYYSSRFNSWLKMAWTHSSVGEKFLARGLGRFLALSLHWIPARGSWALLFTDWTALNLPLLIGFHFVTSHKILWHHSSKCRSFTSQFLYWSSISLLWTCWHQHVIISSLNIWVLIKILPWPHMENKVFINCSIGHIWPCLFIMQFNQMRMMRKA